MLISLTLKFKNWLDGVARAAKNGVDGHFFKAVRTWELTGLQTWLWKLIHLCYNILICFGHREVLNTRIELRLQKAD